MSQSYFIKKYSFIEERGEALVIELKRFIQDNLDENELNKINNCANMLLSLLNEDEMLEKINIANQPGNSSSTVQAVLLEQAKKLGFSSEKTGLFKKYKTSGLRPDYFKKMNGTGILFEVERGKTIQNNMDLMDLWKCHICEETDYLFLFAPKALKQNENDKPQNTFRAACNRLETFFIKENYVKVKAVFVFGY